ncbi:hypothetical protein BaRGS_00016987, partial [Batillaria attramentaria]
MSAIFTLSCIVKIQVFYCFSCLIIYSEDDAVALKQQLLQHFLTADHARLSLVLATPRIAPSVGGGLDDMYTCCNHVTLIARILRKGRRSIPTRTPPLSGIDHFNGFQTGVCLEAALSFVTGDITLGTSVTRSLVCALFRAAQANCRDERAGNAKRAPPGHICCAPYFCSYISQNPMY